MNAQNNNTKELTYEIVMQMFAETDKKFAETREHIDKVSANIEKNGIQIKEVNAAVSGIGQSNGAMAEEMIYNALEKDMIFGGIEFDDIDNNKRRKSKKHNLRGEYDVLLKNGDTIAIIETKYRVRKDDVDKLRNKILNDFRILYPEYSAYKVMLGIGGMSFDDGVEEETNDNGIGLIKIVGDKVEFHTEGIKTYR